MVNGYRRILVQSIRSFFKGLRSPSLDFITIEDANYSMSRNNDIPEQRRPYMVCVVCEVGMHCVVCAVGTKVLDVM